LLHGQRPTTGTPCPGCRQSRILTGEQARIPNRHAMQFFGPFRALRHELLLTQSRGFVVFEPGNSKRQGSISYFVISSAAGNGSSTEYYVSKNLEILDYYSLRDGSPGVGSPVLSFSQACNI
ncbi:uncharacterized protein PgNI_08731, partial [Pyricularia grisea]|uniref:Uncharacterized protein n=1 Tax=Pyricularia grisea TaxID=148305 RepID=A0A6P8AUG4_PYRGI